MLILFIPLEVSIGTLIYSAIEGWSLSLSDVHLEKGVVENTLQVLLIVIMMTILAGVVFEITKYIRDKFSISKSYEHDIIQPLKSKRFYLSCLGTYFVMFLVNLFVSVILNSSKTVTTSNQSALNDTFSSGIHGFVWIIMESILIAPIIEEFLFRWSFFEPIKKLINNFIAKHSNLNECSKRRYLGLGKIIAWVYSSIAFSLLHVPTNMMSFGIYFWMGLCIGYIYQKWDSIYASMAFHSFMNLLVLCFMITHV